jgi:hypothetical protein
MRALPAALAIAASLLIAAGCARQTADKAVAGNAAAEATPAMPAMTATSTATASTGRSEVAPAPTIAAKPAPTEAHVQPEIISTDQLDKRCRSDADCAIKDVGSCCGYNPRCVNKDVQTFPERVKARCSDSGRASICGFPALSGCHCEQGQCAGISGGSVVH